MAIVGLGLIGGSLGLALRRHVEAIEVVGVARRHETAIEALSMGAVQQAGTELGLVANADLVVIACPLAATLEVLDELAPLLADGARVTDVGSVKGVVCAHAERVLDGQRNPFLGGHPMAGKEVAGIVHAEAGLFRGRPWVFTPASGREAAGGAPDGWHDLWQVTRDVGALPAVLSPEQHDRYVALVSHVPFLLSAAFLLSVGGQPDWPEAAALASSGFRDISRLGAGDPGMYAAISSFNREQLLRAWGDLQESLERLGVAVGAADDRVLRELLTGARETRLAWARDHPGLA